jgi:CubicO group peptidase (beta-lactamase class C family)
MKITRILLILALTLVQLPSNAITKVEKSAISHTIKQTVDNHSLRGAHFVALVDENGLVFFDSYTRDATRLDENTQFLIASHTKAMTSTLFAILADNNDIDLNQPLSAYSSQIVTNKKVDVDNLSINDLLTHQSGFTSIQHTFETAFLGYQDNNSLVSALNERVLVAPDKSFRYSNTGPIVSAMIAESELGKSWGDLIITRLFQPLGLNHTTTRISEAKDILPAITSSSNAEVFYSDHHKTDQTMHASGGVVSTANDMATWLKHNINQDFSKLAKNNIFTQLHSPQVKQDRSYFTYQRDAYTLGWDMATYNGERLLTRFGNYGGYSVHVSFMPEHKLGVISFTNLDAAYVLPHVLANFAYNTMLSKDNTQTMLQQELLRLNTSIQKTYNQAPDFKQIVAAKDFSSEQLGEYVNGQTWPAMTFYTQQQQVKVKWGVLSGFLLKNADEFHAHFGVLDRPLVFSVDENNQPVVTNGSLVYLKE